MVREDDGEAPLAAGDQAGEDVVARAVGGRVHLNVVTVHIDAQQRDVPVGHSRLACVP